jgi:hypothetical protein
MVQPALPALLCSDYPHERNRNNPDMRRDRTAECASLLIECYSMNFLVLINQCNQANRINRGSDNKLLLNGIPELNTFNAITFSNENCAT